jgi:hypothetical protein
MVHISMIRPLTPPIRKFDNPTPPPCPDSGGLFKNIVITLGVTVLSTALTQITNIAVSEIYTFFKGTPPLMPEENEYSECPECPNCVEDEDEDYVDDTEEFTREEMDAIISEAKCL